MCKVSVIVPVYNTEKNLSRCIDSILGQSFSDFELLLVDDGSPDGCGAICDSYAQKDSRVRVFHKENGGVSSARNVGLDNARGEWITFVDSDDELLSDGLKVLVDNISDDVDMVMGGHLECEENGKLLTKVLEEKTLVLSKEESIMSLYNGYGPFYFYSGYAAFRLFRNQIIQKQHIRFDTEIAIKEDTLFVLQYLCRSNGIVRMTTFPVYMYYHRVGSAMIKPKTVFNPKVVDSFYSFVAMKHEIEQHYPSSSDVVFVAKQGIFERYALIKKHLNKFGIVNNQLRRDLRRKKREEAGSKFLFRIQRKFLKRHLKSKRREYREYNTLLQ